MKANELEYKEAYRMDGDTTLQVYLGQEGKKYWFIKVKGQERIICSGKFWMNEKQVEKFIIEKI